MNYLVQDLIHPGAFDQIRRWCKESTINNRKSIKLYCNIHKNSTSVHTILICISAYYLADVTLIQQRVVQKTVFSAADVKTLQEFSKSL